MKDLKKMTNPMTSIKESDEDPIIICAAIRDNKTGIIVCGVRHFDCINAIIDFKLVDAASPEFSKHWTCGFVDQFRTFYTRKEAWDIANRRKQIRRPAGWERKYQQQTELIPPTDNDLLFSENLY